MRWDEIIRSAILELDCEILVPAALENQILAGNVKNIKAKIIAEAANGPISPEAEEVLIQAGRLILPDIYLNAGGVTVSYFEWLKNLQYVSFGRMTKKYEEITNRRMVDAFEKLTGNTLHLNDRDVLVKGPAEIDFVRSSLEETMARAYHEMREAWNVQKLPNLRVAAFRIAIDVIAESYITLEIFP